MAARNILSWVSWNQQNLQVCPRHSDTLATTLPLLTDSLAPISQLCGKLAAEGNVVIAMEHRDGTAPATIYPVDGKVEAHHYIKVDELECVFSCSLSFSED
jgi:hypothetical protein